MTCEVAVMNKLGIALAADSAVTVNDGEKVYHHVDKIFPLSSKPPVAVLIYGSAEIMGVPWEIIVKMYLDKFANKQFPELEDYAHNFLAFVSDSKLLFPISRQRECFRDGVGAYWSDRFFEQTQKRRENDPKFTKRRQQLLSKLIIKENDDWSKGKAIEHLPSNFAMRVTTEYARELKLLAKEIFGRELLSPEVEKGLIKSVQNLYSKYWSASEEEAFPSYTGVVFAGMGRNDVFPVLQDYQVADIVLGRLRYRKAHEARVTHDYSAHVVPLAQRDMIDLFYMGIHPTLMTQLPEILTKCVSEELGKNNPTVKYECIVEKFNKSLDKIIRTRHMKPLIDAVDALPRHDLATMALALVSLTELRRKMAINEAETVAGPIKVALLSKRDGFVWVEREHHIEPPAEFSPNGD
jgi:hypothetical protein